MISLIESNHFAKSHSICCMNSHPAPQYLFCPQKQQWYIAYIYIYTTNPGAPVWLGPRIDACWWWIGAWPNALEIWKGMCFSFQCNPGGSQALKVAMFYEGSFLACWHCNKSVFCWGIILMVVNFCTEVWAIQKRKATEATPNHPQKRYAKRSSVLNLMVKKTFSSRECCFPSTSKKCLMNIS